MDLCERHGRLRCGECAYIEELQEEIEGLKERLKSDVTYWHETWEQERNLAKGQKEHLHQQAEKYRTALEKIERFSSSYVANEAARRCREIARMALEQ